VDRIQLAYGRVKWPALLNTVMEFQVLRKLGNSSLPERLSAIYKDSVPYN
jgi:hypothetical protein